MSLPKPVPTVRSLPSRLPPAQLPKSVNSAPLPVFVGELAVKDIRAGSVLTITTENHIYTVNMSEGGRGMLMTNNQAVPNGLVIVHGSWDWAVNEPKWGGLQRGMGFLFAHASDVKSCTRTSTMQKITLVRKGV